MPRGDRTGPWGFGPRTGRGLGYCSGFSTPGYTKGPGMGWGRGWRGGGGGGGWGRGGRGGWGRGGGFSFYPFYTSEFAPPYPAPPTGSWPTAIDPKEETKYLEQTLTGLKKEIDLIEKRLEELASEKKD